MPSASAAAPRARSRSASASSAWSGVFSPWARLYHFESKTRDPRILESDLATLQGRWARRMQVELYCRMM